MDTKVPEMPNVGQVYYVTWHDLPLSGPTPQMRVRDSHPRIYLPIQESGHEQCPYCGAIYILRDDRIEATPPVADRIDVEDAYHDMVTRQHGIRTAD
jgi:uncharacterized Zn-finger protein